MKHAILRLIAAFFAFIVLGSFSANLSLAESKKFSVSDIPAIRTKKAIHIGVVAGDAANFIIPYVRKFEEKTGIKVSYEYLKFNELASREITEIKGKTGAFDLVVLDASWTNEWEEYLLPVKDLAEQYGPSGYSGLQEDLEGQDKGMLRACSTHKGVLMGLPYYTDTMLMVCRRDIYEHQAEQDAFKGKYGYDLAPPSTWEQVVDQAQFFTRKKGELLKGEPLKQDFFGVSLMAGGHPNTQDEVCSMVWAKSGLWASPMRDENNTLIGFKITDKDKETLEWAFSTYQKLMPFGQPGKELAHWEQATAAFIGGRTAMIPTIYAPLWPLVSTVEKRIPGARASAAPTPGERPYTGAFCFAVDRDSRNPEAAYWLLRYITSYEVQLEMAKSGWASARRDSLKALDFGNTENHATMGWIPIILKTWEKQEPEMNYYLPFNSPVFGKLYSEMGRICHENALGKKTPKENLEDWINIFSDIQTKQSKLPVIQ